MNPANFWNPFDKVVQNYAGAYRLIRKITAGTDGRVFAWRGVANASWALHSSLYRRLLWTRKPTVSAPTEAELQDAELRVIRDAQGWGLHSGDRGRLSVFEFLATLQHYGAPTRFIDVTFNPYAALFFSAEDPEHDSVDGRIFAVEVTGRLLNGNPDARLARWERVDQVPWTVEKLMPPSVHWGHVSYVWKPAGFDRRIAAQQGGFLLGGVPVAKQGAWPTKPSPSPKWAIDDVRRATSVPVRPHVVDAKHGNRPARGSALYSFRVKAEAKAEIRQILSRTFGLTHATMYPDFPGFSACGVNWLAAKRPK